MANVKKAIEAAAYPVASSPPRRIPLHRDRLALGHDYDARVVELLQQVGEVEAFYDGAAHRLALTMVATLHAAVHDEVTVETVPVSWWDAFKLRFFAGWMLRRWPPAMREVKVRAQEVPITRYFSPSQSLVYVHQRADLPPWRNR